MSNTVVGMAVAAVLALTWVEYGFWWFVFVGVAIVIGALVGRAIDGKFDVRSVLEALRGNRTSS